MERRADGRGTAGALRRVQRAGSVAWAFIGLVLVLAVLGVVAWALRVVFPPLILAGAIVFLLNPVVTRLHHHGVPRAAGAGLAYLAVVALVALAGALVVPLATGQAQELSGDWPDIRAEATAWIDARSEQSQGTFWQFSRAELSESLTTDSGTVTERLERVQEIGTRVFEVLLILFLGPIIAFYLLVDLPHVREVAESLVPRGARREVLLVAHRLNHTIGGFFRGQLAVAALVGVLCSIGLAVIGLRFWFIIGMIAGLFNLVPLIGPWIGGVPGVIIALTTGSPLQALGVVAVMAAAQQIDNHLITPQVMQRAVRLHPAAVMLALLAGGTLGGFFGLLLAVPLTAVLKVLVGHFWRTYVLGEPLPEVEREQAADDTAPSAGLVAKVAPDGGPGDEVPGSGDAGSGDAGSGVPGEGAPADGVPADGVPADGGPGDGVPADGQTLGAGTEPVGSRAMAGGRPPS